jgi:hypothetical protein
MDTAIHEEDLKLARQTCEELRSGNNEAILRCHTATPFASIGLGLRLAKRPKTMVPLAHLLEHVPCPEYTIE